MATSSAKVHMIRRTQRADGLAAMLAIGTANPPNCMPQDDFPDYYFRVTNSDHLTALKHTLTKICKHTATDKRFFHHTEALLNAYPELVDRGSPSLDARLDIAAAAAPELAASAAANAIARWGRPAADITHLVVATSSGAHAPGADLRLASLLGLRRDVRRTMLQLGGCSAGCAALRLAKDLAENSRGARVLVACVELTVVSFRGPGEGEGDGFGALVGQALFGDGAGAVVVGADPVDAVERPLFEMVSASQTVIPGTEHVLTMKLTESGVDGTILLAELPALAGDNVEQCLLDAFAPLADGAAAAAVDVEWNDFFWAVHPGSRKILDSIEKALRLEPRKLAASRSVLREYGNMLGASVIFVLEELRRRMDAEEEGLEWGAMVGFGPGFTAETMVLRSPTNPKIN